MGRIVVGVDGSEGAAAALRWAVAEAGIRAAQLEVIWTWTYPIAETSLRVPAEFFEQLQESAEAQLTEMLSGVDTEGVDLVASVVRGPPAPTLTEAAEDADLLVVGSRGRGGFKGLLLGSVSQQCAQHAPCPVVIVRSEAQ